MAGAPVDDDTAAPVGVEMSAARPRRVTIRDGVITPRLAEDDYVMGDAEGEGEGEGDAAIPPEVEEGLREMLLLMDDLRAELNAGGDEQTQAIVDFAAVVEGISGDGEWVVMNAVEESALLVALVPALRRIGDTEATEELFCTGLSGLVNLAGFGAAHAVFTAGGLDLFLELLASPHPNVQFYAVAGIENLTANIDVASNPEVYAKLYDARAEQFIKLIGEAERPLVQSCAADALINLRKSPARLWYQAAIKIQAIGRGHVARTSVARGGSPPSPRAISQGIALGASVYAQSVRQRQIAAESALYFAATDIQRLLRGGLARKVTRMCVAERRQVQREGEAATSIQKVARGRGVRVEIALAAARRQNHAATDIQRVERGHAARAAAGAARAAASAAAAVAAQELTTTAPETKRAATTTLRLTRISLMTDLEAELTAGGDEQSQAIVDFAAIVEGIRGDGEGVVMSTDEESALLAAIVPALRRIGDTDATEALLCAGLSGLINLAGFGAGRAVFATGGLDLFLELLASPHPNVQFYAVAGIENLMSNKDVASDPEVYAKLYDARAEQFIELIGDVGRPWEQTSSADALNNMRKSPARLWYHAAIKIQAIARGHLARTSVTRGGAPPPPPSSSQGNALGAGVYAQSVRQRQKAANEKAVFSLAATDIQRLERGRAVRAAAGAAAVVAAQEFAMAAAETKQAATTTQRLTRISLMTDLEAELTSGGDEQSQAIVDFAAVVEGIRGDGERVVMNTVEESALLVAIVPALRRIGDTDATEALLCTGLSGLVNLAGFGAAHA
ncbi:hypothetical protein T492DRAFT_880741, partial [Pavlovales sp. CCMP2436]